MSDDHGGYYSLFKNSLLKHTATNPLCVTMLLARYSETQVELFVKSCQFLKLQNHFSKESYNLKGKTRCATETLSFRNFVRTANSRGVAFAAK